MLRILLSSAFVVGLTSCAASSRRQTKPCPPPGGRLALPANDGRHSEPVEWWYWTGHLSTAEGRRFGYQIAFFLFDGKLLVDNAALADLDGRRHLRAQGARPFSGAPSTGRINLKGGTTRARGSDGAYTLAASFDGGRFELTTTPGRGAVLHHGNGHQIYPFGGYTYYYSRPRMPVEGTVTFGDAVLSVHGESWFDHQWGDLQPVIEAGWDWFGIQLDDGRQLMLFIAHPVGQPEFVDGTLTDAACGVSRVDPADVSVRRIRRWISPESGCAYPIGWELTVGDLNLTVTPAFDAQEIYNVADPPSSYWEGASSVTGDATGRAYVELAGYCRTQR